MANDVDDTRVGTSLPCPHEPIDNARDEQIAEWDSQLRWTLSRFCSIAWFHANSLAAHDQIDSGEDCLHLSFWDLANSLGQLTLVDGDELGDIRDRITIEARVLCA